MNREGESKQAWRRWAKTVRAGLDTPALSARTVTQLRTWPTLERAQHVLTYLAFGFELDLSALPTLSMSTRSTNTSAQGKTFYATRIEAEGRLTVHRLGGGLELHPYGFDQPAELQVVDPQILDLVLVPGLAFDLSGTRLGYGKGFYDRLLPLLRAEVPRVGVVPDALIVEALPRDPHDASVTHLLSETGLKVLLPGRRG